MYDVTFCVIRVTTILSGYYKRDERNKEYLEQRHKKSSPQTDDIRLSSIGVPVSESMPSSSRTPKGLEAKPDLFTLLVEAHKVMDDTHLEIKPVAGRPQRIQADLRQGGRPLQGQEAA